MVVVKLVANVAMLFVNQVVFVIPVVFLEVVAAKSWWWLYVVKLLCKVVDVCRW